MWHPSVGAPVICNNVILLGGLMDNKCKNHPAEKALSFCRNCGEYFCAECLDEGNEYYYCKNETCHNEFLAQGGSQVSKSKGAQSKIITTIVTLIVIVIAGLIGRETVNYFWKPSNELTVDVSEWNKRTIANTGLSIELPFELEEGYIELPEEYKSLITEMSVYQFSSNPMSVNLTYAIYSADIDPSLDGAAQGAINNMRVSKGVKDFSSKISETKLGVLHGRSIEGKYKIQNQLAEFKGVIYMEGLRTWQLLCTYLAKDENRLAVNRIMNSVDIAL